MFCPNCGANVPENSKFCPKCGTKIVRYGGQGQAVGGQAGTGTAVYPGAGGRKLSRRTIWIIVAAAVVVIAVIIIIIATSGKKSYTVYWYDVDGTLEIQTSFDGSNHLEEAIIYDESGTSRGTYECQYNSDGSKQKESFYAESDTEETGFVIEYVNTNGIPSTSTLTAYENVYGESSDSAVAAGRYTCDADGNILNAYYYTEDGTDAVRIEYTYDDSGNMLTSNFYDSATSTTSYFSFKYTYDENGNILTMRMYDSFSSAESAQIRCSYTYDNAGNAQSAILYINGEEVGYGVYKYN